VPSTLLHNSSTTRCCIRRLLVRVVTENISRVAGPDRIKARELGAGFTGFSGPCRWEKLKASEPDLFNVKSSMRGFGNRAIYIMATVR
jgi:hypothetical protein